MSRHCFVNAGCVKKRVRREGGRNIRTRSQACIDDTLLIDLPPDTYMHAVFGGLPLQDIEHCLITHSHFDHFVPEELDIRAACCVAEVSHGFTVYGTNKVEAALGNRVHDQKFSERVGFSLIEPFVSFTLMMDFTRSSLANFPSGFTAKISAR